MKSAPSTDTAKERGRMWGVYFREQAIDYGRPHDAYPSNPYPAGSKEAKAYDAGYEEAFRVATNSQIRADLDTLMNALDGSLLAQANLGKFCAKLISSGDLLLASERGESKDAFNAGVKWGREMFMREARDDVLEEAAKVADGFNYFYPETARTSQGQTAVAISVAIRDLKNAAPQATAAGPNVLTQGDKPAESASLLRAHVLGPRTLEPSVPCVVDAPLLEDAIGMLRDVSAERRLSSEPVMNNLLGRSPAMRMREEADKIENADNLTSRIRAFLRHIDATTPKTTERKS